MIKRLALYLYASSSITKSLQSQTNNNSNTLSTVEQYQLSQTKIKQVTITPYKILKRGNETVIHIEQEAIITSNSYISMSYNATF